MPDQMQTGGDPSEGFCRICGKWAKPQYPGYYKEAVCSTECHEEFKWRETLHIMRRAYRPHGEKQ